MQRRKLGGEFKIEAVRLVRERGVSAAQADRNLNVYMGMTLVYAGIAIGLDEPVALALLPLVLIAIQTHVIAREERYLETKFGDDYRRYKAEVRRWL
ncbi:hypothetical protein LNAOJCKE_5550 [Methylorubrum aminovorans]|uniref:Isoprenylcysteine carboxyl methyltransferase n=1 Tax=Methylorubrum aminovorans TaxID=269069 RepID=A0ABQ4UMT0_9HYPH|nr:hypothetical protein LNAOJCKE_5550 [Methylorubrum aminovorans]